MKPLAFTFAAPFDFAGTLRYIQRFETAQPGAAADNQLVQVLADSAGYFVIAVRPVGARTLEVALIKGRPSRRRELLIRKFVRRTFGIDAELLAFYRFAQAQPVLARVVRRFHGVRIVGLVSLWECLAWSVIGQQVSVASAFAVRSRLARRAGAVVAWNGGEFEGFPPPAELLELSAETLRHCGLTRQKTEYVRGIARALVAGKLVEEDLRALPFSAVRRQLLALRGIGPWSTEYALLRAFGDPDACPLEDIGLRNALQQEYGLDRQATVDDTERLTAPWRPYRGFGTFYLWQTLLKKSGEDS